jgi:hypothetical protein
VTGPGTAAAPDPGGELLPELAVPAGADPPADEAARAARWAQLDRRALLSVHPAADARYSLYADHPLVRAELATLAAAEAAAHPELEVAALVGDGHLVLAVRPRPGRPR